MNSSAPSVHEFLFVAILVVAPTEGHLAVFESNQAVMEIAVRWV